MTSYTTRTLFGLWAGSRQNASFSYLRIRSGGRMLRRPSWCTVHADGVQSRGAEPAIEFGRVEFDVLEVMRESIRTPNDATPKERIHVAEIDSVSIALCRIPHHDHEVLWQYWEPIPRQKTHVVYQTCLHALLHGEGMATGFLPLMR